MKAAEVTLAIMDDLRKKSKHLICAEELLLLNEDHWGCRKTDFWTLTPNKSSGFATVGFEIKASRSDFKRDSYEKQKNALKFSNRFYYVAPEGMLDPSEIPAWAGLMCWLAPDKRGMYDDPFKYRKKAVYRDKEDPDWLFVSTLLRSMKKFSRDSVH